jgi:hypothetical protein
MSAPASPGPKLVASHAVLLESNRPRASVRGDGLSSRPHSSSGGSSAAPSKKAGVLVQEQPWRPPGEFFSTCAILCDSRPIPNSLLTVWIGRLLLLTSSLLKLFIMWDKGRAFKNVAHICDWTLYVVEQVQTLTGAGLHNSRIRSGTEPTGAPIGIHTLALGKGAWASRGDASLLMRYAFSCIAF